jgi:GTP-binding protein
MFIDRVNIIVRSGKGGPGSAAFHREKFVTQGGPSGGDGGDGGSVYIQASKNCDTLSNFRGKKHYIAPNGEPGMNRKKFGADGEDILLTVPVGTQVYNDETGDLICDLVEENQRFLLVKGGKGGLGNVNFKSSTNQSPTYAQGGLPGVEIAIRLDLKLIADVGLVGFPNVGKSTLISVISSAKPEVADYEFTTLTPKLGVVDVDVASSFVIADIPGIIEGASEGRGLGFEFLRHIERTAVLLFMIDLANYREAVTQFHTLQNELVKYSSELEGRHYAICLTKIDAVGYSEVSEKITSFIEEIGCKVSEEKSQFGFGTLPFYEQDFDYYNEAHPAFIAPISSATGFNKEPLKFALNRVVRLGR